MVTTEELIPAYLIWKIASSFTYDMNLKNKSGQHFVLKAFCKYVFLYDGVL